MNIQDIVDEANCSIGADYCANVCRAYCCKKTGMWIEDEFVNTVTKGHLEFVVKKVNGFSLLCTMNGCPALDDNRCSVRQELWPKYCREFPLRFRETDEGRFLAVFDCQAAQAGLLDAYIARIEAEGVQVTRV